MSVQQEQRHEGDSLWNDPVLEEIHAIRRRLWEEAGRDVRRYIERARDAAARSKTNEPTRDESEGA
jgi:hypothetical protein